MSEAPLEYHFQAWTRGPGPVGRAQPQGVEHEFGRHVQQRALHQGATCSRNAGHALVEAPLERHNTVTGAPAAAYASSASPA